MCCPTQFNKECKQTITSLQNLISKKREAHIQRFEETQQAENDAYNIMKTLPKEDPWKSYDKVTATHAQTKAKLIYDLKKELTERMALLAEKNYLNTEIDVLVAEQSDLCAKQGEAEQINQRVEKFSKIRKDFFGLISGFMDHGIKLKDKIVKEKKEIKMLTRTGVKESVSDIKQNALDLNGLFFKELQAFRQLILDTSASRLVTAPTAFLSKLAAAGCDIERFEVPSSPTKDLLQKLQFGWWSSPATLLDRVLYLKNHQLSKQALCFHNRAAGRRTKSELHQC